MRTQRQHTPPDPLPQTRGELQMWVRRHLGLTARDEALLDRSLRQRLQPPRASVAGIQAGSDSGACPPASPTRWRAPPTRSNQKDATVSSISRYFEQLVADLTDKSQRDPKTKLMNFSRFTDQLESFLALEQRGRWCAVGLVDITQFKWYNDALGHAVGDRIILRVAQMLREQVRSDDVLAQERPATRSTRDLHARFGGDEFCFLIPELAEASAGAIASANGSARRSNATTGRSRTRGWRSDRSASTSASSASSSVASPSGGSRAPAIADALIQRADELMYQAKGAARRAGAFPARAARERRARRNRRRDRATPPRPLKPARARFLGCQGPRNSRPCWRFHRLHGGCSSRVRAPVCGTGGCGFNSRHPPHFNVLCSGVAVRARRSPHSSLI